MRCFIPICLCLICALPDIAGAAESKEHCSEQWVCVQTQREGEQVAVFVRNLKPHPVTITTEVRGGRVSRAERDERTITVAANQRTLLREYKDRARGKRSRVVWDWTVGSVSPDHDEDYLYRLPYAPDRSYRIVQGYNTSFSHKGRERYTVDFDMPVGTEVYAARDGVVAMLEEGNDIGCWEDWCARHANYLLIMHADGTTGEYYHLRKNGVLVNEGDEVRAGQLVALSGNTGHTTMPHLHFGVYRAVSWGRTQSIAVSFATADGVVDHPRGGMRLRAGASPAR